MDNTDTIDKLGAKINSVDSVVKVHVKEASIMNKGQYKSEKAYSIGLNYLQPGWTEYRGNGCSHGCAPTWVFSVGEGDEDSENALIVVTIKPELEVDEVILHLRQLVQHYEDYLKRGELPNWKRLQHLSDSLDQMIKEHKQRFRQQLKEEVRKELEEEFRLNNQTC